MIQCLGRQEGRGALYAAHLELLHIGWDAGGQDRGQS